MPYVDTKALLLDARKNYYAIPAFNVENMEMIQAVIQQAAKEKFPVILQTTPSTVRYGTLGLYAVMVQEYSKNFDIPVALHLDHGNEPEMVIQAMNKGYTSVMIDASSETLSRNIQITRDIVRMGQILGISVEAELGCIGGKEDNDASGEVLYTETADAVEFVRQTKVDSLAIAIGTAHGFYKGIPQLNINRLKEIKEAVEVPLVLHGTSGVPENIVKECIKAGICKVNYATDLRKAFTEGIRKYIEEHPENVDPKKYLEEGKRAVREIVKNRIQMCKYP